MKASKKLIVPKTDELRKQGIKVIVEQISGAAGERCVTLFKRDRLASPDTR